MRSRAPLLAAAAGLGLAGVAIAAQRKPGAPPNPLAIHVTGSRLHDGAGRTVQLRGSTFPELVKQCVVGGGFADATAWNAPGPERAAAIAGYRSWGMNCIRLQLNELCFLGANGYPTPPYTAAQYQVDLQALVSELRSAGLRVILVLSNGAPSSAGTVTTLGENMADLEHAPTFWALMARQYGNQAGVIFELYNEPNSIDYPTLRDGGVATNRFWGSYQVAGYQQLLDTVRAAGARNVCLIGAPHDSGNPSQWLQYVPHDPLGQLGCSIHAYMRNAWVGGAADAGRDQYLAPILAAGYPLVLTECGESDCADNYITAAMSWCDAHGASYLPFGWNVMHGWDCTSPTLNSDWAGTPSSAYGAAVRTHLLARQAAGH